MPQLDFAYFPSQILWLLLSFTVLYLFLKHLILPKIEKIITNRLIVIEQDLQDAAKLRDEATLLQQTLDKKAQNTHDQLAKMHSEMLTDFLNEREKQIKAMNASSASSIAEAIKEIELATKEAGKEIDEYIITHSQSLITSIVGIQPSISDLNQSYNKMGKK